MPRLQAIEEEQARKVRRPLTPNEYKDIKLLIWEDEDAADKAAAAYLAALEKK
jgi:hypothetical protein